jgi:hypothetical protein
LLNSTVEVNLIKDYGAIQIRVHQFLESKKEGKKNWKQLLSLHVWQKRDGEWKITKVVSYDY